MSYERLVSFDMTKEQTAEHEKKWGRFNDPPTGFKEITAEQFAQSGFFTWCNTAKEFRQVDPERIDKTKMLTPVKTMLAIQMFYMNHGEHYAIANDYWAKMIRYFTFADCYHDWKEISAKEAGKPAYNCYHYCKCTKCGANYEYDSSG
jgi:hypothetical protein